MKFAMIGLGKMGANMVRRLINNGHEAQVYDVDYAIAQRLESELGHVHAVKSIEEFFTQQQTPRVIWKKHRHPLLISFIKLISNRHKKSAQ